MSVYIYCLKQDYCYQSQIKGRSFENEWLKLDKDGEIMVKGSHLSGYAWDGCSPKIKIKDIYIGIWEAVLNPETGESKTYYASLIHDIFYQLNPKLRSSIKRKEVDREFYKILKRDNFSLAKAYYLAARIFGWIAWYRRR